MVVIIIIVVITTMTIYSVIMEIAINFIDFFKSIIINYYFINCFIIIQQLNSLCYLLF